jgi:hypothetical protein
MPQFGKFSKQEIEEIKKRRRPGIDLSEYLNYLGTLKTGDWGYVDVGEGESPRAIKRRITQAAKEKGMTLRYKPSQDNRIIFEVK